MYTIDHNPRCSKSREALSLLEDACVPLTIVRYLDDPLDAAVIKKLLKKLGMPARELMRQKEAEYNALGLANPALSEDDLIDAIIRHPRLLERPVVIHGNRAVIARPPERVEELLK